MTESSNILVNSSPDAMYLAGVYIVDKFKKSYGEIEGDWQWSYFLLGTVVLTTSFSPMVKQYHHNSSGSGSCGSSCVSSCGGCGGD